MVRGESQAQMIASDASGGPAPTAARIQAHYRNGQVFITWDEPGGNTHNRRVYLSDEPITPRTLARATLLTEHLEPHSGKDWTVDPALCPRASGPPRGWIIETGNPPLDPDSGLFVHTVDKMDAPRLFFAVLSENERPADLRPGLNSLRDPVTVQADEIEAIYQLPGESPAAAAADKPLALYLHPHTSRPPGDFTHLVFGTRSMGWREGLPFKFKVSVLKDVVLVEPYDRVWINRCPTPAEASDAYDRKYRHIETWWYGTTDTIHLASAFDRGTPTNYTERILLWMIQWVQKTYKTDPNRTYGFGASMGTGIQRLALQNPRTFASVDVLVPLLDVEYETQIEPENIKRRIPAFGDLNTRCSDGIPLKDRFDLVDYVCSARHDLPFIVLRAGRQDTSVGWKRKPDYLSCIQQSRHGILAAWDNGDHVTAMRQPRHGFPDFRDYAWHIDHFALDKSYPAFGRYTLNDDFGDGARDDGDPAGYINHGLDWRILSDEQNEYELLVRHDCTAGTESFVDITPRRRQKFRPAPGTEITARNLDAAGRLIEEKNLTVDARGTITCERFRLTPGQQNRLRLLIHPQ